jgi:hypothetical protein
VNAEAALPEHASRADHFLAFTGSDGDEIVDPERP